VDTLEWLLNAAALVVQKEANKNVPLEVTPEAKHDRRGILSMARWCAANPHICAEDCCTRAVTAWPCAPVSL